MHPFNKTISEITLADVQFLMDNQVSEGRTLDYKRDLYQGNDKGKVDFLKDVSSLANTVGGYLVIGVEEEEGIPKAIQGIEIDDFDKLKLQFENLLRMSVDPPIRSVEFHNIDFQDNKEILIIEIQRSISRPHAIQIGKHFRFYGRNSSGNYPYEVDDIRRAIIETETFATKMHNFRNDRIAQISVDNMPIQLCKGPILILHLLPITAFEIGGKHNLTKQLCVQANTFGDGNYGWFNFDGYIITEVHPSQGEAGTYTQIFHNGIIEAVDKYMLGEHSDKKYIIPYAIEDEIIKMTNHYLSFLQQAGNSCPVWIALSLLGVSGYWFNFNHLSERRSQRLDRNDIIIPEVQIEDFGTDIGKSLKPTFDILWNAFGHECSKSYDKDGNRKVTR